jgi:hypothetical protein
MDHVKIHDRSGDNYKITVTFDKGEGSLIKGIYSKKGNFIKWGEHSPGAFFTYKWIMLIPGEATNLNLHVKEIINKIFFEGIRNNSLSLDIE